MAALDDSEVVRRRARNERRKRRAREAILKPSAGGLSHGEWRWSPEMVFSRVLVTRTSVVDAKSKHLDEDVQAKPQGGTRLHVERR
jgi:hypothetical protein